MNKVFLISSQVIVTIICLIVFSANAQTKTDSEKIIYINDADWPPYFFKGQNQTFQGIGKELLIACIPSTGFNYDFSYYPLKRMRKYIENGTIDTNIFSYKKERANFLLFGKEPLFSLSYRPITLKNSTITIDSLSSFDNLRLGHLAGLRYSTEFLHYIEKRQREGTIITVDSNEALFELLLKGRIDVFVNTQESVLWQAKTLGIDDTITALNYDVKTSDYFFTVSKKSPRIINKLEFVSAMDKCVQTMKKDGRYQAILKKYNL